MFEQGRSGEVFEELVLESCKRFGWELPEYCIMRNHYHLAVETPEANLSVGMQWLQSVFGNRFNRYVKTPGHVFQGRYKSPVVEAGPSLLRGVNYIHLNLAADACAVGNENVQVRVEIEVVAESLDGDDDVGLAVWGAETGADHVAKAQPCRMAEAAEQLAVALKHLAQAFGQGDDNLPVIG